MPKEYIWPKMRTCLEDYYEMLRRCNKCNACKHILSSNTYNWKFGYQCPSGEEFSFECYYATGRIEMAIALAEERLDPTSDSFRHALFTCTGCGSCEATADMACMLNPLRIIEELKIKAVEKGGPLPGDAKLIESCKANFNPFNQPHAQRSAWVPEEVKPLPEKADVMYFAGCTPSYQRQEIAAATVKLLKRIGVEFGIPGEEEHCCGSPFLRTGNVEFGRQMMEHNLDYLKSIGAKTVIFSCPDCYRAFSEAEKYDLERTFECLSVAEYLEPLLPKLQFKRIETRLTYHDPCQLGRQLMVYEPPRNILTAIPGVELVEMPRSRRLAFCCGAGSGVMSTYPEFAAKTARRRLEEVTDPVDGAGVRTLVTHCPSCKQNFLNVAPEFNVEVKDVTEIVLDALL
jgi:heterodisulfide reductase subunit D